MSLGTPENSAIQKLSIIIIILMYFAGRIQWDDHQNCPSRPFTLRTFTPRTIHRQDSSFPLPFTPRTDHHQDSSTQDSSSEDSSLIGQLTHWTVHPYEISSEDSSSHDIHLQDCSTPGQFTLRTIPKTAHSKDSYDRTSPGPFTHKTVHP